MVYFIPVTPKLSYPFSSRVAQITEQPNIRAPFLFPTNPMLEPPFIVEQNRILKPFANVLVLFWQHHSTRFHLIGICSRRALGRYLFIFCHLISLTVTRKRWLGIPSSWDGFDVCMAPNQNPISGESLGTKPSSLIIWFRFAPRKRARWFGISTCHCVKLPMFRTRDHVTGAAGGKILRKASMILSFLVEDSVSFGDDMWRLY